MRSAADLNRIIDKIAETNPARLDAPSFERAETSPTSAPNLPIAPRPSEPNRPNASPDVSQGAQVDALRPFVPRLAVDSDSTATRPPRSASARGRRRSETPTEPNGNIGKTAKIPDLNVENQSSERRDDESKRTQRRRQIDPTTCERDYSADEIEFMKALDDYKRASGRMFPTCSEILEVFKSLGYVKTARAESPDDVKPRNVKSNRAATPAFLSDEESDAFEFGDAPVLEIA